MDYPKISVITPSYNQGQFLEETILSVIGQNYPNLEYIIMDGGSTDNSVEIIKKYQKHLAYWVSEKDGGQGAAINKGFGLATGEILAWLNSDDMYLPGALLHVAERFDTSQPEIFFGNCLHFIEGNPRWVFGSDVKRGHETKDLRLADYIIQPSSFYGRSAWLQTGPLDESLVFAFDWDWFIRARKAGVNFRPEDKYLSLYRIHDEHKTGSGGGDRLKELGAIYGRHIGPKYERLFSACCNYRSKIESRRRWIRRLGLSRIEIRMLKLVSPKLFRGFRADEVRDIMSMI